MRVVFSVFSSITRFLIESVLVFSAGFGVTFIVYAFLFVEGIVHPVAFPAWVMLAGSIGLGITPIVMAVRLLEAQWNERRLSELTQRVATLESKNAEEDFFNEPVPAEVVIDQTEEVSKKVLEMSPAAAGGGSA